MSVRSHSYSGEADLRHLIEFASAATRARWPGTTGWHVGDVIWGLFAINKTGLASTEDIRLWMRGDELVGFAYLEEADQVLLDVRPDLEDIETLFEELLRWSESRRRKLAPATEELTLSTAALDGDVARIAALAEHGYERVERGGVRMRRSLKTPIRKSELPVGMRVRDCVDVDVERRVDVHRDAWNHLEHLGMADARSTFSADVYRRLRTAPVYDPELDLVVETSEGEFASCCICWADPNTGTGLFEPVGTRLSFRRKGLGRAINLEGLRRLRDKGMEWAIIGTANFNHAAKATYRSCGFEVIEEEHAYVKRLV